MTYNPPLPNTGKVGIRQVSAQKSLWQRVAGVGSSVLRTFRKIVRASQIGQMIRVLNSMPDTALKEIGVKRSEIPDYAKSLVEGGER